jgi:hypothetical protein
MKKKMKNKMKSDFSKTLFPSPLSKPFFESLLRLLLCGVPCDGATALLASMLRATCDLPPHLAPARKRKNSPKSELKRKELN